tara:strand:- start:342 stop:665 length:324 start_codon:yes stop_codon:yes gene_type:complete
MVNYEWDVETVNSDGDVEDHNFADKMKDLLGYFLDQSQQGCRKRLVLVRSTGDDESGLTGRLWAYVEDGDFERGEFQDCGAGGPIYPGVEIPKRFVEELESCLSRFD